MGQTFVYNQGKDEIKKDEIQLTFGVFIDGTLNNKDNTDMRNKYARGAKTNDEDGFSDIDYSKSTEEIETAEDKEYKKIKNRKRIATLLENSNKTPEENAELNAVPERDRYIVASHRKGLMELGLDKAGSNNSYSNDYTNVARMWNYSEKIKYRIYIEGMGSDKLSKDSQDGFAFGAGHSGIRGRVRDACEQIAKKIQEEKEKNKNKKAILTKITLDVFGFSRGAASARNFVHEVNLKNSYSAEEKNIPDGIEYIETHSEAGLIRHQKYRKALVDADNMEVDKDYLEHMGFMPIKGHLGYSIVKNTDITPAELLEIKVIVRFIGIYDTVSSYFEDGKLGKYDEDGNLKDGGFGKIFKEAYSTKFNDNVGPLKLNILGNFQKLIHFTAKDEHRRNFSLTRIKQVADKAIEKNFPGVHCDIGGAYLTENEEKDEIETSNHLPGYLLNKRKDLLIEEGWFKDNEIDINNGFLNFISSGLVYRKISSKRLVKKEYSYLPLHFMADYCKPMLASDLLYELAAKYPVNDFLQNVKDYIEDYALDKDDEEWEFYSDEERRERREKEELEDKLQNEMDRKIEKAKENNFSEIPKPVYDNLDPSDYVIKLKSNKIQPFVLENKLEEKTEDEIVGTIQLDEIVLHDNQLMLRKLRHEYLHWSADRDWFGMEPNSDRKRREF